MPDAERLTDERVREIAEDGEVYIEPLAESDFGRGVGHENWPSKEAVALAREVLAARAGDREERDTISCNAIPTWPACEDGLDRQQHNDPVCWGCYSAEKAIRREVESQLAASTEREAGLRALCEEALQVAEAYCPRQRDIGDCASCGALRARLASLAAPEGGTE